MFNYLDEGKHVVVDFFFTTCGPCIQSVPTLNQAYNDYGCNTGDVVFIAVDNGDDDKEVSQYKKIITTHKYLLQVGSMVEEMQL